MNAVFERDYVRTSVSTRYLWLRAGFAIAVAGMVAVLCMKAYMTSDYSGVGVDVLRATIWAGLALLLVAVPGTFGMSLVHARAQNALPILFASPLKPLEVAWGAFLSRAAGLSIFVFACWPPVAIALSFGGIRPVQLLVATAALLGSLLLVAAPCFVISAFARATGSAVVASYLTAATLLAALGAIGAALSKASPALATSISPFHAIDWAIEPTRAATPGGDGGWVLLLIGVGASFLAILLAAWRLEREASGAVEAVASAATARGYRPMSHANPILDRELRTGGSLRTRSTGRTLVAVLVVSEIAYLGAVWKLGLGDSIPLFGGFLVFQTALLVLAAAAAGATSLAAEKESGALDAIRVTPLQPRDIVEGKLLGLFRTLLPALAVPCAHLAWGAAQGIVSVLAIPAFVVSGAVVSATWVIVGMAQSLDQRDPHRAVLRTMGVLGIIGFLLAGYAGVVLFAAANEVERWIRLPLAGGGNPIGAILPWVAVFRTGGSDAETKHLDAPSTASQLAGFVGGGVWLVLHVAAALFVFRRLVGLYRTRFEG